MTDSRPLADPLALIRDITALTQPGATHPTTIKGTARPSATTTPGGYLTGTTNPKGWEPGVKWADAGAMTVTTPGMIANITRDEAAWRQMVTDLGLEIPPGFEVRLVEAKFDPAAWHRDTEFVRYPDDAEENLAGKSTKAPAVTRPVWRYRFAVEPASARMHLEDVDRIMAEVLAARAHTPRATAPTATRRALNVVYADPQAGKVALLGGTEALAHRVADCFDLLQDHIRDLALVGRPATEATWLDGGDCIEGFSNVRSQERTNDLQLTQQVRASRRITTAGLRFLADRFDTVQALTCGSNHGRVRDGKDPVGPASDDWGIEVLSAVQDAFALNPDAYGHVRFGYPHDQRDTLAADSGGLLVGLAHGHQWSNPDTKAVRDWWKGQTFGRQPVADARILVTGHFHHLAAREMGDGRLWIQAPTIDSGSDWFTQRSGEVSQPGLLVFSTTEHGWDDLRIFRSTGTGWEPASA